ncbi:MAG TPA: hypothetical protein PKC58_17560, partial [Ignavibacteria bacterium]|nr:hypothetical protein [Ignavibacteria bacterium]
MKTIIFTLTNLFLVYSLSYSQFVSDYPFKTYLDEENSLYITGFEFNGKTNDIFIQKKSRSTSSGASWKRNIENPDGNDAALDIISDINGNCFITGYYFNKISKSNEIIVLALNPDGTVFWESIYNNTGDDKGIGIDISINEDGSVNEIFISGYINSQNTGKDIIIKKYDEFGVSQFESIYPHPGDDVATDITLD